MERLHREPVGLRVAAGGPRRRRRRRHRARGEARARVGLTRREARGPRRGAASSPGPAGEQTRGHPFFFGRRVRRDRLGPGRVRGDGVGRVREVVRRRRRGFSRGAVIRGRRRTGKRGFTVPGAGDARLVLATRPRGWPRGKASAARGRAARPERVTAGERDGGGPRAARKPGGPAAALSRAAPGAPSGAPYMAFLNLNARAPPPLPPAPSLTSGFVRPGAPLAASAEAAQSALCFSRPTRDSTSSANVASFTAVSCGKPRRAPASVARERRRRGCTARRVRRRRSFSATARERRACPRASSECHPLARPARVEVGPETRVSAPPGPPRPRRAGGC